MRGGNLRLEFQLPDASRVAVGFRTMGAEIADFSTVLRQVAEALERNEARIFDSQGVESGGRWAPLSGVTLAIREQTGFAGEPILQNTGSLRAALTESGSRYALRTIGEKSLVFGTRGLPYASHHQFGTTQRGVTPRQQKFLGLRFGVWMRKGHVISMPARPILTVGGPRGGELHAELQAEFTGIAREHIVAARRAAGDALPSRWDAQIARDFDARIGRGTD